MFTFVLPLFRITSLLFSATDFSFFPRAFACDGDEGGAVIPCYLATLIHRGRISFTATALASGASEPASPGHLSLATSIGLLNTA